MSQPPKTEQILTEVLEVKAALSNITELLTEQRDFLSVFGKALQDCVEVLQPPGHLLRKDITPQQPTPQQPTATQPQTTQPAPAVQPAPIAAPAPADVVVVKSGQCKIGELKDGDKKVNVTGKVVMVNAERKTKTGKRVTEGAISNNTGSIRLSLWENQIDLVKEGSTITIENGYITTYENKPVLNIGQYGKLTVETTP